MIASHFIIPTETWLCMKQQFSSKATAGIEAKPSEQGFKLFALVDSKTGYTVDFTITTSKTHIPSRHGQILRRFDVPCTTRIPQHRLQHPYGTITQKRMSHKTTRKTIHKMDLRSSTWHRGTGAKFQSAPQFTLQTLIKLYRGKWNCQMAHR